MEIKYLRNKLSKDALDKRNREILKQFNEGKVRTQIAQEYGITTQQIYNVINSFKNEK